MTAKRTASSRHRRHEEAADWLLRNREAGQGAKAGAAFQSWLRQDPENSRAYAAAERLMGEARTAILMDPALKEHGGKARRPRVKASLVYALAAGAAIAGFLLADGPMRLQADALSGTDMPVIQLADGSTLQLNAFSAVAYDFTATTRKVRLLRGEAYFQVARDAARPFVVEAQGGRTTALGTAFDVRISEASTDVTVTEHAVSIAATEDAAQPPQRVEAGQQALYGPDGRVTEVKAADTAVALAWRRGLLVVDNAPLSQVVEEIGRHFSGTIVIASPSLAGRRVSGTFSITDTPAVLAFLEQTLGITALRLGPLIVLYG